MATYDQASWEALYSELERQRAECNLLREMFNSAERELAAERERCAKIAFDMVAKRDPKFAWDVRATIRKGEP